MKAGKMGRIWTLTWLTIILAGCTGQQGGTTNPPVVDAQSSVETSSASTEPVPEPNTPKAVAPQLELQEITAQDLGVLSGGHLCIDESSLKRTCIQSGDNSYPSPDNLFLDVAVRLKNFGDEAVSMERGSLVASYEGRTLRYEPIEREMTTTTDIQALGSAVVHSYFEVPIEVLNEASFALAFSNGEAMPFSFETPASKDAKKQQAIAEATAKEEGERLLESEKQARYDKCWSLNDRGAPLVSPEDYGWYVENCSHMYSVDAYETYLENFRNRN